MKTMTVIYEELEPGFYAIFINHKLRFYLECAAEKSPFGVFLLDNKTGEIQRFDRKVNAVSYIENSARGQFLGANQLTH